jgi:hypothetical protein
MYSIPVPVPKKKNTQCLRGGIPVGSGLKLRTFRENPYFVFYGADEGGAR